MMTALYRGLTSAFGPAIDVYLRRRLQRGKEDAARFDERLGHAGRPRPPGALVWMHAASVGETVSILPLIERLLAARQDLHLLLTTGTVTSAALAAEQLPARACHQYVPVDRIGAVRTFLEHWRPDLGIWVESELWPNLIAESRHRAVPLALINARMSPRSYRNWRLLPFAIRPLLSAFRLCLAQSEGDAQRLRALGAADAAFIGNLKAAAPPLAADAAEEVRLETAIAGRPVWLAASTHPGEEDIVARVHDRLTQRWPDLLTLLVPRHANRGAEIAAAFRDSGLDVACRSAGDALAPSTGIYLGDTMGEMGLYYRLAPIVFVGGSLVPHGGQNPLEPARLDSALLFGPHMFNFAEAVAALSAAGAAVTVADGDGLAAGVAALLDDPAAAARQAEAAASIASAGDDVVGRVLERLQPLLPQAA